MLKEAAVLEVERRQQSGKNAANRYRDRDLIPAVIYGGGAGLEPMSLVVPRKALATIINQKGHENSIFKLRLKGTDQERHVMIRDMSVHPVSRRIQHVDFVRILTDRKLKIRARIDITGIPKGVKNQGGFLNVVTHDLMIECLPADIPESIHVDVSELALHDSLRVSDLKLGENVKILGSGGRVIAHVGISKGEESAVAATAPVAPAGTEPEVIKKGKKEEEAKAPEKKEKK
ncbi:MAG: 50S ribosomal protein L25 [Acidobacteria bacterium]|nr:50S ribosomal protein L25 [Acidobacteriota bacterium]MCG3194242.1 50S ribosomal protein L25 [Thermoanaerobaculia bacterium]MCK6684313.1 50S ribosomal protein L25 [Thermoanaerobaculia bacterium]